MFTALTLTAAMLAPAAPVPKAPPITGEAPRVVHLKPGADGKIVFMTTVVETQKVQVGQAVAPNGAPNGGAAPAIIEREVSVTRQVPVGLADLKNLIVTTAGGKLVEIKDAVQQLERGGIVVISADAKPVDPGFLKIFKDDTLVLVSPDLVNTATPGTRPPNIGRPIRVQPGVVRPVPLPAPAPGNIQILPAQGGVQILLAQGGIQIEVAPAQPVPGPQPQPMPANSK